MAEQKTIAIDLNIDQTKRVAGLEKDFRDVDAAIKSARAQLTGFTQTLERTQKAYNELGGGKRFRAINQALAGGGPDTQLRNSFQKGITAQMNATQDAIWANITNTAQRKIKDFGKAARNSIVQEMSLSRQFAASQNKDQLGRQIEAQRLRVDRASGDVQAGGSTGRALGGKKAALQQEQNLLDNLLAKQKEITAEERKQAKLQTRQNALSEKRSVLTSRFRQAAIDGNRVEKAKILVQRQQLKLDQQRLAANGQITAEIRRQERRLSALRQTSERLTRTAGTESARQGIKDRLFGDGGAGLFAIQGQLLANFALMGAAFQTFHFATRFVLELDQTFKQLQAITATTSTEMATLEKRLIAVSEKTKFTAVEVAQAAVNLGQAGFSTEQIKGSIESITLLATATGTDLAKAVDLATSTISVFNLQAMETSTVTNTFTAAVNNSKLTIDKLTLGVQYAGNIASQSGIAFQELTAAIGAMANSGIRSGSMLGTGLRRLLISFQAPEDKLIDRLNKFGLTAQDVNVEINGLAGAMQNLRTAGFTVADAMDVLEIRAGAAFAALTNNIDSMFELRQIFTLTNAAVEANAVQMEGLSNKLARLQSIFGSFVQKAGGPFIEMLKVAADGLSRMFQYLTNIGPLIGAVGTGILTFASGAIITKFAKLFSYFFKLNKIIPALSASIRTATVSVTALGVATKVLTSFTGIGLLLSLITGVSAAIWGWNEATSEVTDKLDKAKAEVDRLEGSFEKQNSTIKAANTEINRLINRSENLKGNQVALTTVALELQEKFGDLGAQFDANTGKVDDFIEALVELRQEARRMAAVDLDALASAQRLAADREFQRAGNVTTAPQNGALLGGIQGELTQGLSARELSQARRSVRTNTGPGGLQGAAPNSQASQLALIDSLLSQANLDPQAKAQIRSSLALVTSGQSAGGSPISQGLSQSDAVNTRVMFQQSTADINKLQQKLGPDISETEENILELLKTRLKTARDAVGQGLGNNISADRNDFKRRAIELSQDSYIQGQEADLQQIQKTLTRARKNLSKARSPKQQSLLQGKIQVLEDQVEQVRTNIVNQALKLGLAGSQSEALALASQTDATDTANELVGDFKNFWDQIDKLRAETVKRRGDAILDKLNQQSKNLADSVSDKSTLNEIKAAEAAFMDNLAQQRAIRIKQQIQELRNSGDIVRRGSIDRIYQDINSGNFTGINDDATLVLRNVMEKEADKIAEKTDSTFGNLLEGFREAGEKFEGEIKSLSKRISQITKRFAEERRQNELPLKREQARAQAMQSPEFRNQFSDVERQAQSERVREAEVGLLRANINSGQREIAAQRKAQEEAEVRRQGARFAIAEAETTLLRKDSGNVSEHSLEKAAKLREKATDDLRKATDQLTDSQLKQAKAEQDVASSRLTLAGRTGELNRKNLTLTETIRQGTQQWLKQNGAMSTMTTRIGNQLSGLYDSMAASFSNMVSSVASGSATVGEAFKSMATAIIQAMLEIAAKEIALQLFGFATSVIGGIGGGSYTGSQPLTSTGGAGGGMGQPLPRNDGGMIRAANGMAVPNRDSVPILARPGEFVLRNAAVDAIGRDNLEQINALGNRQISEGSARIPQRDVTGDGESSTVNVYVVSPDQQPIPTEKDIVAYISQDISRGGSTKKLIKQVQTGRV